MAEAEEAAGAAKMGKEVGEEEEPAAAVEEEEEKETERMGGPLPSCSGWARIRTR